MYRTSSTTHSLSSIVFPPFTCCSLNRTAAEWQAFFANPSVDVPVTAVLQPETVWEDEQLAHRGMTIDVPIEGVEGGVMSVPRTPLCMGGVDFSDKAVRGPALGEHNSDFGL